MKTARERSERHASVATAGREGARRAGMGQERRNGLKRGKIVIYGLISFLLFFGLLAVGFLAPEYRRQKAKEPVQIVTFGDSVFGMVRDETAVPCQIGEKLGKTVYNAAFGGTMAARTDWEYRLTYTKDTLSLVGLMKSVEGDDFGVQQAAHIRESMTEYFPEVIDGLAKVDFPGVETVLIQHGLNDYYAGVPIENPENAYDTYSYSGALRTAVSILQEKYPRIRVYLVTPTYSWAVPKEQTCEELNTGYGVLEDYVEAQYRVAEEFGIEVIDLYHDFFPHEQWSDWELYTTDGLHPNEAGREKMAEAIYAQIMCVGMEKK